MFATAKRWVSGAYGVVHGLLRQEAVLFLVIGGINTLLNYALYLACLLFFSYGVGFTIAYVIGVVMAYCLNSRFVFKARIRVSTFVRYLVVYVVQYIIGITLLYVIVEILHISPLVAPWIIILVTIPVMYRLTRFIMKRDSARAASGDGTTIV